MDAAFDKPLIPMRGGICNACTECAQVFAEILLSIEGIFLRELFLKFRTVVLAQDKFIRPLCRDAEQAGTRIVGWQFFKEEPGAVRMVFGAGLLGIPDQKVSFRERIDVIARACEILELDQHIFAGGRHHVIANDDHAVFFEGGILFIERMTDQAFVIIRRGIDFMQDEGIDDDVDAVRRRDIAQDVANLIGQVGQDVFFLVLGNGCGINVDAGYFDIWLQRSHRVRHDAVGTAGIDDMRAFFKQRVRESEPGFFDDVRRDTAQCFALASLRDAIDSRCTRSNCVFFKANCLAKTDAQ